ncbi:MAG TPA: serine/threonine-protein kinase, partial [Gemmatimonadales bacterium]|nr:serine/threonine-protein kinase [Gemmatimonadales bacterium]
MTDIRSTLQAALAGRYAIERQAGEGGMATVFLATDLKHGRRVAIKVLRPELGATIGSDRFLREIELAARLQHPHIAPVYDSGAAGGILYYVMPFVEGESLRERLRRDGALPLAEAQRLLQEVASALAYAHQQGIVHRDIKPENILLSGGHAVVADFGIARALSAGGKDLTGFGMAIGTPAYMSPEQATASEDVDARSDQYSLACVYYEMLTGRQPWSGASAQAVMAQSLTGPRPKATAHRQGIPSGVDAALARGLARDPADRFPSVTDFAEAATKAAAGRRLTPAITGVAAAVVLLLAGGAWWLGRTTAASPVVKEAERIAVLPFQWTGSGEDVLGEGMVRLLSTNFDAVGGITIVEPSRVLAEWRKKGQPYDLEEGLGVGRALGAEAVVHGSIVGVAGTLRLTADLVAKDGNRLARAQLEGPADSVLGLVDRLSVALLREVWQSSEALPSLRVAALTTASVPALGAYLDGERHYRRAQWDSAAAAFEEAVDQDSTFALAHYRLALTLGWAGGYAGPRAAVATAAALQYADRLPAKERGILTGYRLFADRDPAAADTFAALTRANPDDPDAWYLLGEARMHSRSSVPWSVEEIVGPFDRVLALDSTLTPAVIHPVEIALATRDSARYVRYMPVLSGAAAAGYAERFRKL